jgi:hypothetical protein
MRRSPILVLVLALVGVFLVGLISAPATARPEVQTCSDLRFKLLANDSSQRALRALDYLGSGSWAAAKVAANRAWKQLRDGPRPCGQKLRAYRVPLLTSYWYTNLEVATYAAFKGNVDDGPNFDLAIHYGDLASKWSDRAAAIKETF